MSGLAGSWGFLVNIKAINKLKREWRKRETIFLKIMMQLPVMLTPKLLTSMKKRVSSPCKKILPSSSISFICLGLVWKYTGAIWEALLSCFCGYAFSVLYLWVMCTHATKMISPSQGGTGTVKPLLTWETIHCNASLQLCI